MKHFNLIGKIEILKKELGTYGKAHSRYAKDRWMEGEDPAETVKKKVRHALEALKQNFQSMSKSEIRAMCEEHVLNKGG